MNIHKLIPIQRYQPSTLLKQERHNGVKPAPLSKSSTIQPVQKKSKLISQQPSKCRKHARQLSKNRRFGHTQHTSKEQNLSLHSQNKADTFKHNSMMNAPVLILRRGWTQVKWRPHTGLQTDTLRMIIENMEYCMLTLKKRFMKKERSLHCKYIIPKQTQFRSFFTLRWKPSRNFKSPPDTR